MFLFEFFELENIISLDEITIDFLFLDWYRSLVMSVWYWFYAILLLWFDDSFLLIAFPIVNPIIRTLCFFKVWSIELNILDTSASEYLLCHTNGRSSIVTASSREYELRENNITNTIKYFISKIYHNNEWNQWHAWRGLKLFY